MPEFLERIPTTGCRGYERFNYQYVSSVTQPRYKLLVQTGGWDIDEDPGFYFDSWSRRWGYSEH